MAYRGAFPPPKRSLGIFGGLKDVLAEREAQQQAADAKQMALEDRLRASTRQGMLDMQQEKSRSIEDALKLAQTDALKAKPPVATKTEKMGDDLYDVTDTKNPRLVLKAPPKPKEKKTQLVQNQNGDYVVADMETGLGPDGKPIRAYHEPKEPKNPPAPNEGEIKAAAFSHRVVPAGQRLNTFDSRGMLDAIASKAGMSGNWAVTPEGQKLNQAAKTWIFAVLRPESGATITPDEEKTYAQTYIPQPFDSEAVLAQKRQARREAEEGVAIQANRALPKGTLTSSFAADSAASVNRAKAGRAHPLIDKYGLTPPPARNP